MSGLNRDDIIRLAREAGATTSCINDEVWMLVLPETGFEQFANLVIADYQERTKWDGIHSCHADCQRPVCVAIRKAVAAEREACAKVCLEMSAWSSPLVTAAYECAADAIRERGAS